MININVFEECVFILTIQIFINNINNFSKIMFNIYSNIKIKKKLLLFFMIIYNYLLVNININTNIKLLKNKK